MFQPLKFIVALCSAPLVIWIIPALQITRHNAEYFEGHLDSAAVFYIVSGVSVLIASILYTFREKSRFFEVLFYAWLALPVFWLALIGLSLGGTGVGFCIILALSILSGWIVSKKDSFKETALSVSALFGLLLIGNAVLMAHSVVQPYTETVEEEAPLSEAEPESAQISTADTAVINNTLPDIYHIVLDEFQMDYLAIHLDDEIRKNLGGFTWFPNAFTPSGRTNLALSSTMAGVPYAYDEVLYDYMEKSFLSHRSLLSRLKAGGYKLTGYLHKTYPAGSPSPFDVSYFHRDVGEALGSASRRQLVTTLWIYKYLPGPIAEATIPERQLKQLESQTLLPDDAPYASYTSFETFRQSEKESKDVGGRYFFLHYILPHFPDVLSSDCSYIIGELSDRVEQSRCAIRMIENLTSDLKKEGRFDDALIIVHGDHGGEHLVANGQLEKVPGDHYSTEYSQARSKILLLVKPPSIGGRGALHVDNRTADLFDIYPTILEAADLPKPQYLVGQSLVSEASEFTRPLYYHMYKKNNDTKHQVNEGPLHRFIIVGGEIAFDREVDIPKWERR